jgi:hypothetical protein
MPESEGEREGERESEGKRSRKRAREGERGRESAREGERARERESTKYTQQTIHAYRALTIYWWARHDTQA